MMKTLMTLHGTECVGVIFRQWINVGENPGFFAVFFSSTVFITRSFNLSLIFFSMINRVLAHVLKGFLNFVCKKFI